MCGIAGIVSAASYSTQEILALLHHRGPDEKSIYRKDSVTLMHTRLAIQDVMHGTQPFHFQHYTIIFNGEIYNHLELRKQLSNFTFTTRSDTETLLYLFIQYQFEMLDWLDGMFAFCIFDCQKNQMIFARDRAGKKPLYYYKSSKEFIFASELRVLQKLKKPDINDDVILCYLRAGFINKPHTPYQNIFELEAGHYFILDMPSLQYEKKSYFNLLHFYENKITMNFQDSAAQLEKKLTQSIQDRLLSSDVEVGVFLSGGIDSNLIAAIASQIKPNLKTFTVKFDGAYDESHLAALTAKKYHTQHMELEIQENLQQDIENIVIAYGEPFMDSSAIPSFYVSREARRYVKVILGGDGADELFAGYRRYVPIAHRLMRYLSWLSPVATILPKSNEKKSYYNYFYRMLRMLSKTGLDFYLSATTDIFEDAYSINNNKILSDMNNDMMSILNNHTLSRLDQFLYLDFTHLLFCDLLVKMDIASMANSLEVRSPFLSKNMLEFAPSLPDHFKIKGTTTKYILRHLAKKYLPAELIDQPKRGFEVPLKKWVNHELHENIFDRLKAGCYCEKYIERKFIDDLKNNRVNTSDEKRAKMLWCLYCLEIWHANL